MTTEFNINEFIAHVPKHFTATGEYNDHSITLKCNLGHISQYLFKTFATNTKCASCDCTRLEKTLRSTAERYFQVPFSRTHDKCFENRDLQIVVQHGTPEQVTSCNTTTTITLLITNMGETYKQFEKLCKKYRQLFSEQAQTIIASAIKLPFVKESVPITLDFARLTTPLDQLGYNFNIVAKDEVGALCIENCFYFAKK